MQVKRIKALSVLVVLGAAWGLCGAEDEWSARFAASFEGVAAGRPFAGEGVWNGRWTTLPAGAVTTSAVDRVGLALDVPKAEAAVFTGAVGTTDAVTRIDFAVCPAALTQDPSDGPDNAAVALTPALLSGGRRGWIARAEEAWVELSAPGAEPAPGVWCDVRVELRTIEGARFVSYLVKAPSGWRRLATAHGRAWFRTRPTVAQEVAFAGRGVVADFSGRDSASDEARVFHWCGGAGGDWTAATNWVPVAERAPGAAGDVLFVEGVANVLLNGVEATVSNLVVACSETGPSVIGGDVLRTEVTLDVSRPRLGVPLTAEVVRFMGLEPRGLTCAWFRGTTARAYAARPIAEGVSYTPTVQDCERWLKFRATDACGVVCEKEFFFSRLPVLYLTTDDGVAPSKNKEEHAGRLVTQGNADWKAPYAGAMTIKVRGNTSAGYSKKPYKIKLEEKTKLFGMPKQKHWVLLANWNDMAQLRNKLAADFANASGSLGMRSTWVDCFLNGGFIGCYLLSEHIRVDKNRVDIYDWDDHAAEYGCTETDYSPLDAALAAAPGSIDLSGGYLLEFSTEYDERSRFMLTSGKLKLPVMVNTPEYACTSTEMMTACRTILQRYFDACTAVDGSADGRHYSELCDVDSMVAYWLVNELFANNDATKKSRYAYLDRGGRLMWGPVWDFDWGFGSIATANTPERWTCSANTQGTTSTENSFFKEWVADPYFLLKAYERYWEKARPEYVRLTVPGGAVDQAVAALSEAGAADDARWPRSRTHAEDVRVMRVFFATRLAWLDRQFASVATLRASLCTSIATHPYEPDPVALPIAFADGARKGEDFGEGAERQEEGVEWRVDAAHPVRLDFVAGSAEIASVGVFVNGLKVATRTPDADGRLVATLPIAAFTAERRRLNCVSLVAVDRTGALNARNYALVRCVPNGTVFLLR